MNTTSRRGRADPRGGVPSASRLSDTSGDGVRPIDWQRALIRSTFAVERPKRPVVLAVAYALQSLAPGRAHQVTGWTFFASIPTLVELTGLAASSVSAALAVLRAEGWVDRVRRGGGTGSEPANIFRLALGSDPDRLDSPPRGGDESADSSPRGGDESRSVAGTLLHETPDSPPPGGTQESVSPREVSSSLGLLGSGRARDESANDDEPRDEQRDAVEPITPDEVAEVVAASAGRWQERGVRKYAGEFARMFGRADALRRLNEAARDPSARTPRVAGFSKYAAASAERVETVEGPREPACRTCGLVERVCSRTLGSDHEFEPADDTRDDVEPTPTRRGGRRAAGDPDALGNLVEGVLRP